MNKIPAGYRFTFYSSDIRNEHEKLIIKEGLSKEEADLYADLSNLLINGTGIEAEDAAQWRRDKVHEQLIAIIIKYPELFDEIQISAFKEDLGMIIDFISENILGYAQNDYMYMRVLDEYKIEFIPQDILIEDVTKTFGKS